MTLFKGSITALVTPFRNGKIDESAMADLIERQIAAGTHGLVPAGTTGEASTISLAEHKRVIEITTDVANKRVPVMAGAGSNSTAEAVELVGAANEAGAEGILAVAGYYNKPNPTGLVAHFSALNAASMSPIFIYNIPGRAVVDIAVETMGEIARLERVVGVKDATGDLSRIPRQHAACGDDFIQLSGEDITAVGFNAMGGVGCISVTSNVAPELCAKMQDATLNGDYALAREIQNRLAPLHDALFSDASPAPAKYALSLLGLCTDEVRLPLVPASAASRENVERAMQALGLIT